MDPTLQPPPYPKSKTTSNLNPDLGEHTSSSNRCLFLCIFYFMNVCSACTYGHHTCGWTTEGKRTLFIRSSRTGVSDGFESPYRYWELNSARVTTALDHGAIFPGPSSLPSFISSILYHYTKILHAGGKWIK